MTKSEIIEPEVVLQEKPKANTAHTANIMCKK